MEPIVTPPLPKEKNVFTETNSKIKKIKKKLEKIAQHEAKYKDKAAIPSEIQNLLSLKSHLIEKLNNYTTLLDVAKPTEIPHSNENIEPANELTKLLLLGNLLYPKYTSESSKYADHIRGRYGMYIEPIWNATFNLPCKFTLTTWKKKIQDNLALLLSRSQTKIEGSGVSYKEAMDYIDAAFNDSAMINVEYENLKQYKVGTFTEKVSYDKINEIVSKTVEMPKLVTEKVVSYPVVSKEDSDDDEWIVSQ